jgi:hypothetical protein
MFGIRKALGTVLLVVAFLALSTFAAFYYNLDKDKKAELDNNNILKYGQVVLNFLFSASVNVENTNTEKSVNHDNKVINFISKIDWRGIITGTPTVSKTLDLIDDNSIDKTMIDRLKAGASEGTAGERLASSWSEISSFVKESVTRLKERDTK